MGSNSSLGLLAALIAASGKSGYGKQERMMMALMMRLAPGNGVISFSGQEMKAVDAMIAKYEKDDEATLAIIGRPMKGDSDGMEMRLFTGSHEDGKKWADENDEDDDSTCDHCGTCKHCGQKHE